MAFNAFRDPVAEAQRINAEKEAKELSSQMEKTSDDKGETEGGVENRISQQNLLLAYCDRLELDYYKSYTAGEQQEKYPKIILVDDMSLTAYGQSEQFKNTPHHIKKSRDEDAGKVYYSYEDLNIFMNSLDPLALSMLQPYIKFTKVYKGKEYVLDLEDANRATLRAFLSGKERGVGSIGHKKEVPGGFGIEKFDLEYLVNKESKYLFDLYKIHFEFFFGSMEDIQANLGTEDNKYSVLDVLIAFPDDVKKFQMAPGLVAETDVSNAYKVSVEIGYNIDGFEDIKDDKSKVMVKQEWYNILKRNNNIDFNKFRELIKKMRFKIDAQVYKWDPKFTEDGNIRFQFDLFGYERGLGSHPASNVLLDNSLLDDYVKLSKDVKNLTKEEAAKKDEKEKNDKAQKKVNVEKYKLKEIALKSPFYFSGFTGKNWEMQIDSAALTGGIDTFSFFGVDELTVKNNNVPPTDNVFVYDFASIMNKNSRGSELQVDIEKKGFIERFKDKRGRLFTDLNEDTVNIPYFYLGDLLKYISMVSSANLTQPVFMGANQTSPDSFLPPGSYVEFVLGKVAIYLPGISGSRRKKDISIGAIPVAWDLFLDWWYKKISSRPNLIYKLEEFLQDFIGYFFSEVLTTKDEFGLSDIEIGSHVTATLINHFNSNSQKKVSYYLYQNSLQDRYPMRFFIGNRRGMMKTCEFAVEDDQHLNSYMMASAVEGTLPDNNLQTQRAMYNVNIELFGNAIMQPGMLIEVVPTIIGAPLGNMNKFQSLYDLGIGGFYNIVSSKITLDQGTFNTSIHGKYYGKPMDGMRAHDEFYFSGMKPGLNETILNSELDPQTKVTKEDYARNDIKDWEAAQDSLQK